MSNLLDLLQRSFDPNALTSLSSQIGASKAETGQAVRAALPLLLGALQRNAATPAGAQALAGALDRDHDGSVLDDVVGFFGRQATGSEERSLDHIFGGRRAPVENALAQASGLGGPQVSQLLAQLAPFVLGALARARSSTSRGGAAAGAGGLGDLLTSAMGQLHGSNSGLGGLLGGLLDANGDGSVVDDLAKGFGGGGGGLGGLLGGLLGGKKS